MKKYDITRLSKLKPGDRFYFPKNKKLIYTFIITYKDPLVFVYENDKGANFTENKMNRKVIYLRNIND